MTPRERNQIHRKILTFQPKTFWIPFRCSFQALSHWAHSKGAAHKLPIPAAALWPQPNSNILSTAITQILVPKTCDEVERGCRVHISANYKGMVPPMTFLPPRTCTSSVITVSHMWINLLRRANYLPAIKARTWFHPWCTYISGHVLPSSITTVCHVWIQPLRGARQGHGFAHDILTSEDMYFLYHHCVPYVDKPSAKSKLPASN